MAWSDAARAAALAARRRHSKGITAKKYGGATASRNVIAAHFKALRKDSSLQKSYVHAYYKGSVKARNAGVRKAAIVRSLRFPNHQYGRQPAYEPRDMGFSSYERHARAAARHFKKRY